MTHRLLLVDDDAQVGRLVVRLAVMAGYQAIVTQDAEAFRREYRAQVPDALMLDLSMHGGNGIEILRFLAEENCKAPIIIMSGVERRIIESASRLGQSLGLTMAGILPKPASNGEIRAVLARALALATEAPGEADMATELRFAIERGELSLAYQPKIQLASGRLVGVEALMRWTHTTRGPIGPAEFIPLAEQHGLIDQLTDWGLREALRQCAAWERQGLVLDLAFNLSPITLKDVDFPDEVEGLCSAAGVAPERITFELTESATQDPVWLMDILTRLRLKGVRAAIDDFGTGYSSLVQLRRLPFTELKIDQGFVKEVAAEPDCAVIVKALVELARGLGLQATAEGIETPEVMSRLRDLGCDMAQGYFIARPLWPAELLGWARADSRKGAVARG